MDPFTQRMVKRASSSKIKGQLPATTKSNTLNVLEAGYKGNTNVLDSHSNDDGRLRSFNQYFNSTLQNVHNWNFSSVELKHAASSTTIVINEPKIEYNCETSLPIVTEDKFSSNNTDVFHATFMNSVKPEHGDSPDNIPTNHKSVELKYCESDFEKNYIKGYATHSVSNLTTSTLKRPPLNSNIAFQNCTRNYINNLNDSISLNDSCDYLYQEPHCNVHTVTNLIKPCALEAPSDVDIKIKKESPITCAEWESEKEDGLDLHTVPSEELSVDVYDMDKFLEEALGDELLNSSGSETRQNSTVSSQSHNHSLAKREEDDHLYHTVSHYRTLTQVARQKIRSPLPTAESLILEHSPLIKEQTKQKTIQMLHKEASKHLTTMTQASKALDLCRKSKIFNTSSQHVECERILLLSSHKHQASMDEMQYLMFKEHIEGELQCGSLKISNLSLPLKEGEITPSTSKTARSSTWLVCLLSHRETVFATQAISQTQDGSIHFPGSYYFHHLDNDFVITLQVYSLKLERTCSSAIKHQIYKNTKNALMCTSSCKLIHYKSTQDLEYVSDHICVRTSAFVLEGTLHLQLQDLTGNTFWNLSKVPLLSTIVGTLSMSLKSSVKSTTQCSSFLTMYEEAGGLGAWHRQWCHLSDHTLKYWNYPTDMDIKAPCGQVDLLTCTSRRVEPVDRTHCARGRTFLLETRCPAPELHMGAASKMTRYLLSADTLEEMVQWCFVLNRVLSIMRDWYLIPEKESS